MFAKHTCFVFMFISCITSFNTLMPEQNVRNFADGFFKSIFLCENKSVYVGYSSSPSAAYMRQRISSALVQVMACRLFGAKPLSKPMLGYC